uniref:ABC transporter domain-containing protein n=1 Tax=Lactuca sativa TaxID=4236 RepID=A0A9R1X2Y7_LACSA|nr:hypothetical protein LSAT_V11C800394940 [Lactuca sativa]
MKYESTISSLPNCLDSSGKNTVELNSVHLWNGIQNSNSNVFIGKTVSDEEENRSMGQRQLFCLGRVLLTRNKFLILNEATTSIDSDTYATVQRIIRQKFLSCTVVKVVNRIPTVKDSDMVMVLSSGEMMEYDAPSKLMESDSYFSKLVAEY